jgi:hypothetical protein
MFVEIAMLDEVMPGKQWHKRRQRIRRERRV